LVLNVGFSLLYDIGDIQVYYLAAYQIAAILAGYFLAGFCTGSRKRSGLLGAAAVTLLAVTAARLPASRAAALASVPKAPEGRWEAILSAAPPGAILLSNDRNEIVPMWYYQYAQGTRPDLLGLFPLISPEPEYAHIGASARRALGTGRPVCLIKEMPGLEVAFRVDAASQPPYCIAGEWEAPPTGSPQALSPDLLLLGWEVSEQAPPPGSELVVTLYWQAQSPLLASYSSYVHLITADRQPTGAGSDHRPGGVYLPSDLWAPGQVIRDEHRFSIPPDLHPGTYRLLVGMYEYPSLKTYGQALEVGPVTVAAPAE